VLLPENDGLGKESRTRMDPPVSFTRKVLIATAIPVVAVLVLWFLSRTAQIVLLFFVGVLLALVLRAGADLFARYLRLPGGWSLAAFVLLIVAVFGLFGRLLAPTIAEQLDQLGERLPQAIERLEEQARQFPLARRVLDQLPRTVETVQEQTDVVAGVQSLFSVTAAVLTGLAVFLAVGIYLAANPALYTEILVRLFPIHRRDRIREVLDRLAHVLRMWLLGRAVGMVFVGVLTATGLFLLDVPLALALGLIAGLLDFIPNIGPLLAAVPAIVIAFTESPTLALYVVALYFVIQSLEAYLIEPLIEQKVVRIAPALNIIAQILLAMMFGFLGLLLATPLVVMLMVLVQELYIRDLLESGRSNPKVMEGSRTAIAQERNSHARPQS
jgi:predicted PurR-regulated permease PerM